MKIVKFLWKQNNNEMYGFQAENVVCGYQVYKNATWEEVKWGDQVLTDLETNERLIEIDR